MSLNADLLKGEFRKHGLRQTDVAAKIGCSLSRFNAKLNRKNGAEFSLGEIRALRDLLSLPLETVEEIFFT